MTDIIKGFVLVFTLTFPTGSCAESGSDETEAKMPISAEFPAYPVDGKELRLLDLTQHWEVNASPILQNFYNLYNCEVIRVNDEEYPYRMWIFGVSTCDEKNPHFGYDSIFHARGKSLDSWEMFCGTDHEWDTTMNPILWQPVMVRSHNKYDSIHNGDPSVVFKDGLFQMAFSSVGIDHRNETNYIVNCVMGAISEDGIQWQKSQVPLLIWEKELEEGWKVGEPTPPSVGGYHRPSLLWDEEESSWKMWFDYYLPGTFLSMGYAVNSSDFMESGDWKVLRAGENPLLRDWPNPEVVKINGRYYAFSDAPYFGSALGGPQNDRRIVMAVSDNGFDWRVIGHILPEEERFGTHLPQTCVEETDGTLYLYVFYSMVIEEDLPNYSAANFMRIPVSHLETLNKFPIVLSQSEQQTREGQKNSSTSLTSHRELLERPENTSPHVAHQRAHDEREASGQAFDDCRPVPFRRTP